MFRSLKSFILSGVIIGSVVIFFTVILFSYVLFTGLMENKARETSRAISLQTFGTMFQIMRKGWTRQELEDFLTATRSSYRDSSVDVDIYRGPIVEKLFGSIDQAEMDDLILGVFASGSDHSLSEGDLIRYVYPLRARDECLQCHINARGGDVLGVIEVKQNMGPTLSSLRHNYLIFLLVFSPFPIVIAILLASFFAKRIESSIGVFREKVDSVNSVKDIKNLDFVEIDLRFSELNSIMHNVSELVTRMRDIAVDKDILEFEIKLMEKFVISSEVVKDWKEYLKQLLSDINTVIDSACLFTIFRVGEIGYDIDIFWEGIPGDEAKEIMEATIRGGLENLKGYREEKGSIVMVHSIADETIQLEKLDNETFVRRTKFIMLEEPKIGGVSGIGLQATLAEDSQRHIVVETILTTLLNAVGAVKAVNKYTKDLEYYATRDPLTNLYNQRVFWDLLEYETGRADRHNYRFALLMIDLDNFKTINDRYGHSFGDLFLKEFSSVIRESTRKEDIVARYGGDEFTIILPESDENQAYVIASRIQQAMDNVALDAPAGSEDSKIRGTMSIGITIYPDHGSSARDLFLVADNMMYRAKREGKNTLVFPSEDDVADVFKQIGDKSMLILEAIEGNKILPYFQPIMEISTGSVVTHELLMRIELNGEITTASEFIDIAENMGVVYKLDYLLLEKAFSQIRSTGYNGQLFVNLSPKALIVGEFIQKVKRLAQDYEIDPATVIFEITERETVRNISLLEKFVHDLKQEGFKFAVDDFGSGFSSFSYLKQFPIDYVKIDGEFIRNMVLDNRDKAMVKSVTTLARELGIKTIAEYVESEELLNAVVNAGIDFAQGYYIGRPSRNLKM